ncbi:TPM domain-containing protein [Aurantimonas sp. Leaf443]|uniref:TPM domain-containing protein n=1 Tax=Aurantimonas sp. Leaf443 TaxID=1736378 RepID=UPI0006FE615B|nr:TPM domain-containing protein [Aurantimonas sp. Leaf443]KQT85520.1 hypothetical protein ASG48_09915 [Aurantimonas sp. Leaf443]
MARLVFGPDDHARVAAAIAAAERGTAGEIHAVFARGAGTYLSVAGLVALGTSLAAAALAALLAAARGETVSGQTLVLGQIALAALSFAILAAVPSLRMAFVPRALAGARASALARSQFLAHGLHRTSGRTGLLIFLGEAEHHAEIIADEGLSSKVPQERWDAIVRDLAEAARDGRAADGFVAAIAAAGAILRAECPAGAADVNELPDRLVEI